MILYFSVQNWAVFLSSCKVHMLEMQFFNTQKNNHSMKTALPPGFYPKPEANSNLHIT